MYSFTATHGFSTTFQRAHHAEYLRTHRATPRNPKMDRADRRSR